MLKTRDQRQAASKDKQFNVTDEKQKTKEIGNQKQKTEDMR